MQIYCNGAWFVDTLFVQKMLCVLNCYVELGPRKMQTASDKTLLWGVKIYYPDSLIRKMHVCGLDFY